MMPLAHQPRRRQRRGVDVFDALGLAGRAGRIHPERNFVGQRRRDEQIRPAVRDQIGEIVYRAARAGERGFVVRARANENDGAQPRQPVEDGNDGLGERCRGNQRRGAAVAEDVGVLLGVKQRVERQRHDAGAHTAPERHREIDAVVKEEREPLFGPQAEVAQGAGEGAAPRLQFAVTQRAVGIGECDFAVKPARDLGVDQIAHRVIRTAGQQVFQH